MNRKIAGVFVAVLMASWSVSALQSGFAAPKRAAGPAATKKATAGDRTAGARPGKTTAPAPAADAAALARTAAIPEADRLQIKAGLALVGDYQDGAPGGDFDERTITAIKAFQQRNGGKDTGVLSDQERALLAAAAQRRERAVGWHLIADSATGAYVSLPTALLPQSAVIRNGSRWTSDHGQIVVETFRLYEAALPALFEDEKKTPRQRRVEWSALTADSFVMSGEQGLKKFVMRVQSSGGELRGITILYDQATEGIMGGVAIAMADTFDAFPDPIAPAPGLRRAVAYGTAIAVSSQGDFIAPAQFTDQCQSITIAGFGHAERAAEDAADDLALLRAYGARNLAPAAIADEAATADALTLVGVADPAAQAGQNQVTHMAARRTGDAIDPVPSPGFSGAAAIDPQGRFAGMVDVKPGASAARPSTIGEATVVPVQTIRSFLQGQGIRPAKSEAVIDQSVVRVICVRK